ncbi:retrovirus-related pol polyprotein from transposon TNT 1-94 [Tanacetum coccineum]|uniref:Retrovirus-related pol polyprotein from transposon TNT 1-94 n=1 Tax=Tanacetum coccineum TaxID=301880 RepID=A0ABQ5J638_9ASTR
MKEIFEELEAEVDQNVVNRKYDEIEQKNLLIANDNLIADCLSKEVFYIATNSELTVSRFTEMHDAHTVVQARCLELEAELSKLHDKVQKDDHTELVKRFSNLEVNHLNLQLKYQNLKESFGNNTSPPARDAPDFDSVFVIEKMKASIQGKDNAIKKLRMQISQLKETRSEADRTLDFRALDFQITQLTEKVTVLQEQNELFRAENAKIKQHYKELYDSIKITRAKHIKQTTALLTKNENLKAQIHENMKFITIDSVKPRVLALGSVETLREMVDEAKVERPLDRSLASAFLYTKHFQELLEFMIGTCPKDFNKRDKKSYRSSFGIWTQCVISRVYYVKTRTQSVLYLTAYYERVGICHQKTVPRTPQQNGVVERRTVSSSGADMLDFFQGSHFLLWAEAVATAYYTQNRSLIHTLHNKTPYELVHDKKPDLTFFHVFGALCYPTNDSKDL